MTVYCVIIVNRAYHTHTPSGDYLQKRRQVEGFILSNSKVQAIVYERYFTSRGTTPHMHS